MDLIDSPVKPVDHLIPPGVNPDEVGYIDPLSNLT